MTANCYSLFLEQGQVTDFCWALLNFFIWRAFFIFWDDISHSLHWYNPILGPINKTILLVGMTGSDDSSTACCELPLTQLNLVCLLILINILTCINVAIIHFAEVRAHTSAANKLNRDIIPVHHYTIIDEMHNTRWCIFACRTRYAMVWFTFCLYLRG